MTAPQIVAFNVGRRLAAAGHVQPGTRPFTLAAHGWMIYPRERRTTVQLPVAEFERWANRGAERVSGQPGRAG